ncbi:DNA primase [Vagococcus intermedius]|uniref:DNA primase n=1 Tax=Vagococcus intermedius TaxID=2991418 RepID=A0AAF0CW59_9ENTE|nr:DNA primase [Vagococcus intermedius]WEG73947.1 DNA primase [Vagococcus intermedius]WEG76027.1 DNA primase [Vagococcus intermedius]
MSQYIPQELIEDIRRQSNIVDIVGQYVQLKKSGKNYFGLCPFHEERSPSFSVAEDKQIFHCFGCGKGGNVFKFLQELEGLSFPEAVKKTAEVSQVSVDFDFQTPATQELSAGQKQQQVLIELHEKAADLYHHVLMNTESGAKALAYLKKRGLTEDLIKEFQIGFAPAERILLQKVFEQEQVSAAFLADSGLMTERESQYLDRFYQRIMFPIKNAQGRVIAFSGRLLEMENIDSKKMPKYLNSPETPIFNKRQVLFNFDKAKGIARKEQELILFEGFMDVIAAYRAGIKHGVASMGTSLTNEQIKMFQRTTPKVVICYDGDNAGVEATSRAVELLSKQTNLELGIVSLPQGLDPDDYIQANSEADFRELVTHHQETEFSFKMTFYKRGKNLTNEQERIAYIQKMVDELVKIPSVIEREVYISQLSQDFGLSTDAIMAEIRERQKETNQKERQERQSKRQVNATTHPQHEYADDPSLFGYEEPPEMLENAQIELAPNSSVLPKVFQQRKLSVGEKAEQLLLCRAMAERGVASKINQLPDFSFIHDEYQELYQHFTDYMLTQGTFVLADFLNYVKEDHLKSLVTQLSLKELSEESSIREIDDYLLAIHKERLELKKQEKLAQQKEANRTGNKQLEQELTVEIIMIQRELKSVR